MKKNITQLNFTKKSSYLQLKMNFNVDSLIPEDGKVILVCNIVERMDLNLILSTYARKGRKPVVDPETFLKIILFCYSEGIFTCRKIESFCKYDIRAHYILNGQKAPDYTTISRFVKTLEDYTENLLSQFVDLLIEEKHIDLKSVYIDGTKIESRANRYTFVWRKSVEKNQAKLKARVIEELDMPEKSTLEEVIKRVNYELNIIGNNCSKLKIEFVCGRGKRKTEHQRKYEYFQEIKDKFETYQMHLKNMGDRNSYSKTDIDATFMRMKEDHMLNGQLKPAYNVQIASSGSFIVGVLGSQRASDMHTLKPFLEELLPKHGEYIKEIVADAGYESVENYTYLESKELKSYIKPSNYEHKKKRKVQNDIGRKENMEFIEKKDVYICKAGKNLKRQKDRIKKYESGFEDTIRVYECYECKGCEYSMQCIKSRKNTDPWKKSIQYSPEFEKYRKESETNITTEEGINHRINRSIQAEGAFSKIKDGLGYDRFRHKGMKSTISNLRLAAIGVNINKLHIKLLNGMEGIIEYKKSA